MRRILLIGGVWMLVLGSVGAVALTASAGGGDQGEADQGGTDQGAVQGEQREDAGVHGGPIERFHLSGGCDLAGLAGLPGNWTHGDYVSTVAANGNPAQIQTAAHSDCGKPMVSVGHGGGPPAHALKHMAAVQAHAGGTAQDEGSGPTGS
jgi:hypothetical protein